MELTNEYASQIENLLSPLVGDLMAKMALKSQCKSLGIQPEDIEVHHLEPLAKKIGFALSIHGHREQADEIVSTIKGMSSGQLEMRGQVKGAIMSGIIDIVSLRWGAGLANELKSLTAHQEAFKPGAWHTILMLESVLDQVEKTKGTGEKSQSQAIGFQLMSTLKFTNANFMFGDTEKELKESLSNLKQVLDLGEFKVTKNSGKEYLISYDEKGSPSLGDFVVGLCEGIIKIKSLEGVISKSQDGTVTKVVINLK